MRMENIPGFEDLILQFDPQWATNVDIIDEFARFVPDPHGAEAHDIVPRGLGQVGPLAHSGGAGFGT